MHINTKIIRCGSRIDDTFNSVTPPIYTSSVFEAHRDGRPNYDYSRSGNPTRSALQEVLASLEGGCEAFATTTGMAAITLALSLLQSGDHIIVGEDIYGGTHRLLHKVMPSYGLQVTPMADLGDLNSLGDAIQPNTKMLWLETPSNPLLKITDIRRVAGFAKQHKTDMLIVADNTFATPILQRPLELGCDMVMHSTTKFLNGHSDVIGGALVSGDPALADRLRFNANSLGLGCSPFDAWLVLRGIRTLSVRMERHLANAKAIAEFLCGHRCVERVYYPGLPTHPQHALAAMQMDGFGGVVSFELRIDSTSMEGFFDELKLFAHTVSLGGVESLAEQPWCMSHAAIDEASKLSCGIKPNLVRLSVGLEDTNDLISDLDRALNCCC